MDKQGKVVILGAGHVGSHCGMALAWRGIFKEIVLVDKESSKAKAQAMDIADALTFPPTGVIVRDGVYEDCADADIVVIAIGEPRKPGQTRLDLLESSAVMVKDLIETLKRMNINGIVISITNPADIVADYVRKGLGMNRTRAFGTGTLLDTARLIRILSEHTGVDRDKIKAFSLGEHGDSSMIPFSNIVIDENGFDAYQSLNEEEILTQTRMTGMDIINGKFSTEFGIGQALSELCKAILLDEKRVFPLSVLLEGEFGQKDVHCGVPCRVGRSGIEEIIKIPMTEKELAQFDDSCQVIKKHIERVQQVAPM